MNFRSTSKKVVRAERKANSALNLFSKAYKNLVKANTSHQEAIAEHEDAIREHLVSQQKAQSHIQSNQKVMDKLAEFLPNV